MTEDHIHDWLTLARCVVNLIRACYPLLELMFECWRERMGGQTRYHRDLDRRMERSINEVVVRPVPRSLSKDELDLEHNQVTEATEPIPVRAWVTFEQATIRPECEAIAWTPRAVQVRMRMASGATYVAWVWASAVDRI
jgi:hypothetical protein